MKKYISLLLAVLLAAGLAAPASAAYTDVASEKWYAASVEYVTQQGLFQGVGDGRFSPGGSMTRGMFVLVLSRVAEADVSSAPSAGFSDVVEGKYDTNAVNWAFTNGYADGTGANAFSPSRAITREEIAVILYNYLSKTGIQLADDPTAPDSFDDAGRISLKARSAAEYMRKTGLMIGSGGNFKPETAVTRAEAAEIFMRLDQRLAAAQPAEGWYVTTPLIVLETSDEDAPYGENIWARIRVTDPYWVLEDGPALGGFFYTFQSSDETVIKVNGDGGLYAPRQLAAGSDPVSAVITVTHMDGTTRQLEVLVVAKAAAEEPDIGAGQDEEETDVDPSQDEEETNVDPGQDEEETGADPGQGEASFTVTTPFFDEVTSIYNQSAIGQIRITDPYFGIVDQTIRADTYNYTFTSSDPSVVDVNNWGVLTTDRLLAPNDEPVYATITVTNNRDGSSVDIPVTISPDPNWYTFDDDYIAAFAAEALRLVNELRTNAGVQPISYISEYQDAINTRTARLEKIFAHDGIGLPHGLIGENISSRPAGVAIGAPGGIYGSPEEMAQIFIKSWAESTKGHYENMVDPKWSGMAIGIYVGSSAVNGRIYSAQWFDK